MNQVQNEYVYPLTVASYDVGEGDRMHLSAVLRYHQEAAEQHLAPGGLGWDGQLANGFTFVLTRWHAQLLRLPAMGEKITITTWHRERRGPRFYRCHLWRDAAGAELIRSVTEYAMVSIEDHRLLRGELFDRFGIPPHPEHTVACADPERWKTPPLSPVGDYVVRRSDTDRNGHMNNTHYGDLCTDFLPGKGIVREVSLHFAGETRPGDRLCMTAAREGDTGYVRGETERGLSFDAKLIVSAEAGGGI